MGMKSLIKKIWNQFVKIRNWHNRVWKDKTDYKVSIYTKIKWALKGFTVNEYIWYDLDNNDYREYISEYERLNSREINSQYKTILDSKLLFDEVFAKHVRIPETYAWISNGIIYGLHDYKVDKSTLIQFLHNMEKTVLKWECGGGGEGVYVIESNGNESNENERFTINGEKVSEDNVLNLFLVKGQAILCEYIQQSQFSRSLYPYTTNTIRIVCAKKKGEEKVHIIKAVQRVGCEASIPVDNAHGGGLACEINIDTGEMGVGIARLGKMENRMIPFKVHPDYDSQLEGRIIPNWEEIKDEVVTLTNKFPYLNFVGWDILLTDEGFCIIEGNASSGCGIFQMQNGVRNEELGEIYRSYGIIK